MKDDAPKTPRDLEILFAETTVQTLIGTVAKSRGRGHAVAPAVIMADHFGDRFPEVALVSAKRHARDLVQALPTASLLGLPAELFKQVAVGAIETVFGHVMVDLAREFKTERGVSPQVVAAQLREQIATMAGQLEGELVEGQGLGGMLS